MNNHIKDHLDLLGRKGTDRVTGFKGVISTISHDLYGCVQAVLAPPVDKDGKKQDGCWFDISRIETEGEPVMQRPNWDFQHGPAEKPSME